MIHTLPPELLMEISVFSLDPYHLIRDINALRHTSRAFMEMTDLNEFWVHLNSVLRQIPYDEDVNDEDVNIEEDDVEEDEDVNIEEDDEIMTADIDTYNENDDDHLADQNDHKDDDNQESNTDESYEADDCFKDHPHSDALFYRTHTFISDLLLNTKHNTFYFRNGVEDDSYRTDQFVSSRGYYHDESKHWKEEEQEDCALFCEKVDQWIEAASFGCENVMLRALLEISLGHEMIMHLGMKRVGACIQSFFHHLFGPAMLTVKGWNGDRKISHVELDQILNGNLVRFLGGNGRLFQQRIASEWNDLDGFYFAIPRQYLLFVLEHFRGVQICGSETSVAVAVFNVLRNCGIHVQNLSFIDISTQKKNFERTSFWECIIPQFSSNFYMQHLAVFTKDMELLEWCLKVDDLKSDTKMAELIPACERIPKWLTVRSHLRTHATDCSGLNIFHYAVAMQNYEMTRLLLEDYICNPFKKSNVANSPYHLAIVFSKNVGKTKTNEEDKILELFQKHYGPYESTEEITDKDDKVKSTYRAKDAEKLLWEKQLSETWLIDGVPEVTYREDDVPMRSHVVMEDRNGVTDLFEICEESDYEDGEEALSVKWMQEQVKHMNEIDEEDENSLKRKRYDPYYQECNSDKFIDQVKDIVGNFEYVRRVADEFAEYEEETEVKILERSWKKTKLEEGSSFLTSREDMVLSKFNFNKLASEVKQDYRVDGSFMPQANMIMQQATEDLLERVFRIANAMALFQSQDYVSKKLITQAYFVLDQIVYFHHSYNGHKSIPHEIDLNVHQNLGLKYVQNQPYIPIDTQNEERQQETRNFLKLLCGQENADIIFDAILEIASNDDNSDNESVDLLSDTSTDSMSSCTALWIGDNGANYVDAIYTCSAREKLENNTRDSSVRSYVGEDGKQRFFETFAHEHSQQHYVYTKDRELAREWNYGTSNYNSPCIRNESKEFLRNLPTFDYY